MIQDVLWIPRRDDGADVEGDGPIGQLAQQAHVVLDEDHRTVEAALGFEQDRCHGFGLGLGQAGGRLVEQDDARAHGDDHRQLEKASHTRRKIGGQLIRVLRQPERLEDLIGGLAQAALGSAHGRQAQHGCRRPGRRGVV